MAKKNWQRSKYIEKHSAFTIHHINVIRNKIAHSVFRFERFFSFLFSCKVSMAEHTWYCVIPWISKNETLLRPYKSITDYRISFSPPFFYPQSLNKNNLIRLLDAFWHIFRFMLALAPDRIVVRHRFKHTPHFVQAFTEMTTRLNKEHKKRYSTKWKRRYREFIQIDRLTIIRSWMREKPFAMS